MHASETDRLASTESASYVTFKSIEQTDSTKTMNNETRRNIKYGLLVTIWCGLLAIFAYATTGTATHERYVRVSHDSLSLKSESEPAWKITAEEKKAKKEAGKLKKLELEVSIEEKKVKDQEAKIEKMKMAQSSATDEPAWLLKVEEKKAKKDALNAEEKAATTTDEPAWKIELEEKKAKKDALKAEEKAALALPDDIGTPHSLDNQRGPHGIVYCNEVGLGICLKRVAGVCIDNGPCIVSLSSQTFLNPNFDMFSSFSILASTDCQSICCSDDPPYHND